MKFFDMYIKNNGIPSSIRLDLAKYLLGHQVKTFCNTNDIEIIEAFFNGHRAVGLVERLMQKIKKPFSCIKEKKIGYYSVLRKACTNDYYSPTANI